MDDSETLTTLRAELAALRAQGDALEQELAAKRREIHWTEQIVETIPGVVWVAEGRLGEPGQRVVYIGGQLEQTLGYSREEWLSATSFALSIIHPEDRVHLLRLSASTFRDTFGHPPHYRYRAKDGREVWIETHITMPHVAPGAPSRKCGVLIDVTERALAEKVRADLLDRSQGIGERLDNVIASVPGLVWEVRGVAGQRHEPVFISEYITAMTGYRVDECVGNLNFWKTIAHPEDAPQAARALAETYAKGGGIVQYRWLTKDGRTLWIESRVNPIHGEGGQVTGAYGITLNITAQKLAEEERARLREEMIKAQAAAMEALGTPLIPLSAHVMVMPLIGAVDQARAERVIEALLQGISRARARFAIIDITGVLRVDASTADALLRAARSVALLGAEAVLTGVRPEVAQTLVGLGADLSGIVTCGNLERGIAYATRR